MPAASDTNQLRGYWFPALGPPDPGPASLGRNDILGVHFKHILSLRLDRRWSGCLMQDLVLIEPKHACR
jgi:hypothetical protein